MIKKQHGFTLVDLQVTIAIVSLMVFAGAISASQIVKYAPATTNRMVAVREVHNAGYWISRDAESAEKVTVDGLTYPAFIVMEWTIYGYDGEASIYHTVTYSFAGMSNGVGKLVRTHSSSAGENTQTLISDNIYYNPADPANSSKASYQNLKLAVKLTSQYGDSIKSREFEVLRRPNFF